MDAASEVSVAAPAAKVRTGRVRWLVCALLFAAVVLSYLDRQVLSVLKPTLQRQYGWTEIGYGDVVFWFQAAYGLGYLIFGRLLDRVGVKVGYAIAVALWTVGHMAHALVTSTRGFALMRIPPALGEAGTFPSALAAVAEWFPAKERSFAIGLFNAGSNVGAIVAPLLVPAITLAFGWRMAFIVTGLFTVVWLVVWLWFYRSPSKHPKASKAELEHIGAGTVAAAPAGPSIPWRRLLSRRETWAYICGRFLIDPVWWTFLFWLPDFFDKRYHMKMTSYGPPLLAIYLLADAGSVIGGWSSSRMLAAGVRPNIARKTAMLGAALIVTPVAFGAIAPSPWIAVLLIGLACAGHQGFSSNLFTLPSDLFPRRAVNSVIGFGGAAGALGSMLMAKYAGWVLQTLGSYTPIFIVAAGAYLVALLVVHLLTPRYAPVVGLEAAA
jgi:ACS family hexuronate transporter-like MFS transporter